MPRFVLSAESPLMIHAARQWRNAACIVVRVVQIVAAHWPWATGAEIEAGGMQVVERRTAARGHMAADATDDECSRNVAEWNGMEPHGDTR